MPSLPGRDHHVFEVWPYFAGDKRPSLVPSKYRLTQAVERLRELESAVQDLNAIAAKSPLVVRVDRAAADAGDWDAAHLSWQKESFDGRLQQNARLLAGEALYHLRTSLEYLAYHLVWLDKGEPHRQSQFPIVSKAADWRPAARRIPGLTGEHLDAIRNLQPFMGTTWTKDLAELSNEDKHRSALVLRIGAETTMSLKPVSFSPDPEDPSRYLVQTKGGAAKLTTQDDRELVPILRSIVREIGTVLNALSPAFGEPADLKLGEKAHELPPPPDPATG